jgi:hypothetical protein
MRSIVVDDFFDDPYSIVEYSKQLQYFRRGPDQGWEGQRTDDIGNIDRSFFLDVSSKLVLNYYDQSKKYDFVGHLNFHRLCDDDLNDPMWINNKIHNDDYEMISIVYLSPNTPMTSGTQLYRQTDEGPVVDIVYHNKFNRLIQFPARQLHSAMNLSGGKEDRITLLFFLSEIKEV